MEHLYNIISGFVIGVIGYCFGIPPSSLLWVVLAFMAIDYVTGITAAFHVKHLKSETCFKGILKKVSMLCVIAISHILGTHVLQSSGIELITIGFYIGNEGISIIENTAIIGVPYPAKLLDVLQTLKEGKENGE